MRKSPPKAGPGNALFAERLRLALAKKGWRAARLGAELGVSRSLAASWTRGRAMPRGATAAKLPELLGVDAGWLFPLLADPVRSVTESSSTQPPEALMALYVDAIVGAVRDILEHDHELELTPRGRAFLGEVFLELGAKLHARGHVDASRLFDVALALKEGERKGKRGP